jgi:hypothetical protein
LIRIREAALRVARRDRAGAFIMRGLQGLETLPI